MTQIVEELNKKKPEIDALIESYFPRKQTLESMKFWCGEPRYEYDLEAITKSVNEVIWNFLDRGGKRWRPAMFLMVLEAIGGKEKAEELKEFALVSEIVHNGTLLVDDIEDSSEMRRGKPCTHKIYGMDTTINTGNAMYFLPLLAFKKNREKIDCNRLVDAYEAYAQEMINVSMGQAMDITWHKGIGDPTEKQYLQMCAFKTGCLARMSAKLAAILAGGTPKQVEACGRYAETVGVAFQIQDDLLDITSPEFAKKRRLGEDIHEGKRTLVVIHAFKNSPKANRLREILDSHPEDEETISEAIQIMREAGSIKYAEKFAQELVKDGWAQVNAALPESEAKKKLESFSKYLIERKN